MDCSSKQLDLLLSQSSFPDDLFFFFNSLLHIKSSSHCSKLEFSNWLFFLISHPVNCCILMCSSFVNQCHKNNWIFLFWLTILFPSVARASFLWCLLLLCQDFAGPWLRFYYRCLWYVSFALFLNINSNSRRVFRADVLILLHIWLFNWFILCVTIKPFTNPVWPGSCFSTKQWRT